MRFCHKIGFVGEYFSANMDSYYRKSLGILFKLKPAEINKMFSPKWLIDIIK